MMEDSICQLSSNTKLQQCGKFINELAYSKEQVAVVRRNSQQTNQAKTKMVSSFGHYDLKPQHPQQEQALSQNSRQYHDNNNNNNNNSYNNNNNNNNGNIVGKVKLLITPPATNNNCGSEQQIIHSSGATIPLATQNNQQLQQRSHTLQSSSSGRQKNYHHHYATDLTSNSTPLQQQSNHYEENILLFATEHNRPTQKVATTSVAAAAGGSTNARGGTGQVARLEQQQVSVTPSRLDGGRYLESNEGRQARALHHYGLNTATGKFVNYYPSWRQRTQSPITQNYSFHVPLNNHHHHPSHQQHQQPIYAHQSRGYSFVAPVERLSGGGGGGGGFNQSFRSRTIAHIPNMVKLTVPGSIKEQPQAGAKTMRQQNQPNQELSAGSSNYEEFYDRPTINTSSTLIGNQSSAAKHLMRSDGDLLKVHVIEFNRSLADQGFDNPFKPGTELSWEADMMVRLMKRGYPVEELPILVETAKQVAREKQLQQQIKTTTLPPKKTIIKKGSTNNNNFNSNHSQRNSSGLIENLKTSKNFTASTMINSSSNQDKNEKLTMNELVRRQSITDLNSGKQAWANSLKRAKSMPKFSGGGQDGSRDADSIDQLITNIENEMSAHLLIKHSSSISNELNNSSISSSPDDRLRRGSLEKASKSKEYTKVPSNGKKINNNNSSKDKQQAIKKIGSRQELQVGAASKKKRSASNDDYERDGAVLNADCIRNHNSKKADLIRNNNRTNNKKNKKNSRQCCVIQ